MTVKITEGIKKQVVRMQDAQHAMQTGVRMYTEQSLPDASPELIRLLKHLRVGINTCMCETATMCELLAKAGHIDLEEFYKMLADKLEDDVKGYEKELKADFNIDITLG